MLSSPVAAADDATATQYNNLRLDAAATYGDGSDGALTVASGTTTIDLAGENIVVKEYTSISIAVGATLDFSNPAADGTIVLFRVIGDVDIHGTVDMRNLGATGGAAVTQTGGGTQNGNAGTSAYNSLGSTSRGGAGNSATIGSGSFGVTASGGGSGASKVNNGAASADVNQSGANSAGGIAGAMPAAAYSAFSALGFMFMAGAGAASGGAACRVAAGSTPEAISGAGGRGAGSLGIICEGDYDDSSATINLAGTNGSAATGTNGTTQYSRAAGGGGGGGAGCYGAFVKGAIVSTGTKTVDGGTAGGGSSSAAGGEFASAGSGADGADGFAFVAPIMMA